MPDCTSKGHRCVTPESTQMGMSSEIWPSLSNPM